VAVLALNHIPFIVRRCKIAQLIPAFFVLQFFECLCLDLPYSFPSYPHHLTNFLECEGAKVTCDPCTIEKGFVFQAPLAGCILTDLGDKVSLFFAFVKSIQRPISSVNLVF
jgi:hypothetical protein